MSVVDKYEKRGSRSAFILALRELGYFFKGAALNIFSPEFLVVFIPLLGLWELLPRLGVVPPTLIPPISDVAVTFWEMLTTQNFLTDIGDSMVKFFLGLGIAIITAIPIGVLMGWNLAIRKRALPLFQLLSPIPPPAWVPITIIFFGIGLPMQTFLIFLGAFYPILFNTYQAVKDTDPRYLASARVFGASELTLILRVYFWHALGAIIMSVKTGVAMGLVMLVIAEMYGGRTGIGYVLNEAKDYFQISKMVVCMVTLGTIGWFLIEILKFVELKLAVWKVGR
ncbi:MAG: ABC transporter permease [Zoogloeaceae bacterium]|jgi:ABC-type nitrate/sulfonate/bicarbonate transport system permease component|nr:ABC transporter permease [Zoogloeaceae bacterium]